MAKEEVKTDPKKEVEEVQKGPVYTGEGFIPLNQLIETIQAYQQRKILCEDVDYIEKKEGKIEL